MVVSLISRLECHKEGEGVGYRGAQSPARVLDLVGRREHVLAEPLARASACRRERPLY